MSLQELMALIKFNWPDNEENYPRTKGKAPDEKLVEFIRHCNLHQSIAVGEISRLVERYDHISIDDYMGSFQMNDVERAIIKMIGNSLRMALAIGLSEGDIFKRISSGLPK